MRRDTSKIRTTEAQIVCVIFQYWLGFFGGWVFFRVCGVFFLLLILKFFFSSVRGELAFWH